MRNSISIPFHFSTPIFAAGAESKSRFCSILKDTVFFSDPFGNLRNLSSYEDYTRTADAELAGMKQRHALIACDLHPEYLSSRYAAAAAGKEGGRRYTLVEVQHHHAHIASCMAENGVRKSVIGVAFDGTGYGTDGALWGGEFLQSDYSSFKRLAHFEYLPLPGGDAAIREPWRMAVSYLQAAFGKRAGRLPLGFYKKIKKDERDFITDMIERGVNTPLTSSAGRLFDAVSSLIGMKDKIEKEGEAAVALEQNASLKGDDTYRFSILHRDGRMVISFRPTICEIVADLTHGTPPSKIARTFHNTLAEAIRQVSVRIRKKTRVNTVALTGGVFHNRLLSLEAKMRLEASGFTVLTHHLVPCDDEGIALGQAVIAGFQHRR